CRFNRGRLVSFRLCMFGVVSAFDAWCRYNRERFVSFQLRMPGIVSASNVWYRFNLACLVSFQPLMHRHIAIASPLIEFQETEKDAQLLGLVLIPLQSSYAFCAHAV
ncbi:MAG: hypothetical protein ACRDCT_20215, partial [Shewanella sp.]